MESKIRIRTGIREEDGVLFNIYKNIPIAEDFIKMYEVMERAIVLVDKVELLLMIYLCKTIDKKFGIVYSNKITREGFINYVKELSKDKIKYKHQTVTQAFYNLKKLGMLVSYEGVTGAYYFNVAFLHIGEKSERRQILKDIEEQENGTKDLHSGVSERETV